MTGTTASLHLINLEDSLQKLNELVINKQMPVVQKRILYRVERDTFFANFTPLFASDLPASEKAQILMKLHPLIVNIELNIPEWMDEIEKLEIHQMRLMVISEILGYRGERGKLMMIGLATSLSSILLGLKQIDISDILCDEHNPNYPRRLALTFNILNLNFVIFSTVIKNLHELYLADFENWMTIAIKNLFQLINLLRMRWDVIEIFNRGRGFQNFAFVFETYIKTMQNLVAIYSKTRRWMQENFEDFTNDVKFLEVLSSLRNELKLMIDELLTANEERIFGQNHDALQVPAILNALTAYRQVQSLPEFYGLMKDMAMGKDIDFNWVKREKDRIEKYMLDYKLCHDDPAVLSSPYGESSHDFFEYVILVYALVSRKENSLDTLDQLKTLAGQFFSEEGKKYHPQLNGFYLAMKICGTDHPRDEDIKELEELLPTGGSPRYTFFLNYVLVYSKLYKGKIEVEEFVISMSESLKTLMGTTSNQKVVMRVQEYIDSVYRIIQGENAGYNLTAFSKINPFDPTMLFLPQFTIRYNGQPIFFVPLYPMEDELID